MEWGRKRGQEVVFCLLKPLAIILTFPCHSLMLFFAFSFRIPFSFHMQRSFTAFSELLVPAISMLYRLCITQVSFSGELSHKGISP